MAAQPWKESLFGCFNDMPSCIMTCCCPCVQYGQNQQRLDGSDCLMKGAIYGVLYYFGCCCLIHMGDRRKFREKYGLQEDCGDCFATCCCSLCAICQEARELNARGAPPSQFMK